MIQVEVRSKALTRTIVEIVLRVEAFRGVITLTKIPYTLRLAYGVILTGYMVRNEVDNHLHSSLMCPLYKLSELLHTLIDICGQVWIDVVIISNRIWRTSPSLYDGRVLTGNAVGRIVSLGSMADNACVPNMAHAHFPDSLQGGGREVVHLSTAVLCYRTVLLAGSVAIAVKTGENLIDNDLTRCHGQKPLY